MKSRLASRTSPYDLGAVAEAARILSRRPAWREELYSAFKLWATSRNAAKREWAAVSPTKSPGPTKASVAEPIVISGDAGLVC